MAISGIFSAELIPYFVDLGDTSGTYVNDPGEDPMIVLNKSLDEQKVNLVYQALLTFHNALPDVYKLFPLIQFYEDLPQTAPPPEIIIFGRPHKQRCFRCEVVERGRYRVIGREVSS